VTSLLVARGGFNQIRKNPITGLGQVVTTGDNAARSDQRTPQVILTDQTGRDGRVLLHRDGGDLHLHRLGVRHPLPRHGRAAAGRDAPRGRRGAGRHRGDPGHPLSRLVAQRGDRALAGRRRERRRLRLQPGRGHLGRGGGGGDVRGHGALPGALPGGHGRRHRVLDRRRGLGRARGQPGRGERDLHPRQQGLRGRSGRDHPPAALHDRRDGGLDRDRRLPGGEERVPAADHRVARPGGARGGLRDHESAHPAIRRGRRHLAPVLPVPHARGPRSSRSTPGPTSARPTATSTC
jgi:hypothetical protein